MPQSSIQRILLVEDDADIQQAMHELLLEEGYEVQAADNGAEALQHLQGPQAAPHLIILDLMMPVMDGPTFRERQLKNADWSKIPVVVISADRTAKEKAMQMRAAGFLAKPLNLDDLLATLAALGTG